MQALASVFDRLWGAQKPFVFFRTPATNRIVLYFQEDDQDYFTSDMETAGFVMRSFDSSSPFLLIPAENKMVFDPPTNFQSGSKTYNLEPTPAEKESHIQNIELAKAEIAKGSFEKVVLSRRFDCEIANLNPLSLFLSLEKAHPDALVYFWFHPQTNTWLGASPERLLVETATQFHTVALAGTLPNSDSIIWADKEKEEQQLVVDAIVEGLQLLAPNKSVLCSERYNKTAGNLVHLCTDITMEKGKETTIEVTEKLHPTPAVGGVPKKESLDFIRANEGYSRSFYTGILGPITKDKKQLFVNLRCAALQPKGLAAFVGGGITAASDPEKEWEEILRKSETILQWV